MRDEKKIVIGKLKRMDCLMKRNIERKVSETGVYRSQHQLLMQIAHHRFFWNPSLLVLVYRIG